MSYGQLSTLGITFQNSYGTAGSTSSIHWLPFLSEGIGLNIPPKYSESIRGVYDEGDTYAGPRTVDGDIETEANPIALGAMLKSVFQLISSTQSGGTYSHLFKPRTADFDLFSANNPLTIYKYLDTGSAMLYQDMNGSTLEMNIANGEFLKCKVGYVGGQFSQIAAVAQTLPTAKRWAWDVCSISFGGTAKSVISAMTIAVDDGALEASHTLNGSAYPSRVKRTGWRSVSIDGTLKFQDQTEYQQFISQTEQELIMSFKGPTEIQSGYYETLELKLPLMRFEEAKPAAGGPGYIEMTVKGRGKYSVTSATAMQITLVNTRATY